MAHFPQPHPSTRAPRVRLPNPESLPFTVEGRRLRGGVQKLSLTGGCAHTEAHFAAGTLSEIQISTSSGSVKGLVEWLPKETGIPTSEQGFRFIALSDEDQERLSSVVALMRKRGHGERVMSGF